LQCDIPKTTAGNEWADLFRMFTAQMSRKGTRNKCASPVLFAHDLNKTTGAFERIQLTSAIRRRDRLVNTPARHQVTRVNVVRVRITRIEFERAFEMLLSRSPVPVVMIDVTERGVSLGEPAIKLERFGRCFLRASPALGGRQRTDLDDAERVVTISEPDIRGRVARVFFDRVLEKLDRSRRMYRWAYSALHTLDVPDLTARPKLRSALVVVLCALGFGFSVTAVVIGWRRLRQQLASGRP